MTADSRSISSFGGGHRPPLRPFCRGSNCFFTFSFDALNFVSRALSHIKARCDPDLAETLSESSVAGTGARQQLVFSPGGKNRQSLAGLKLGGQQAGGRDEGSQHNTGHEVIF
jgi:hypothetical protein